MSDPTDDEMRIAFNEPQLRECVIKMMDGGAGMNIEGMVQFAWMVFKEGYRAGVCHMPEITQPVHFTTTYH